MTARRRFGDMDNGLLLGGKETHFARTFVAGPQTVVNSFRNGFRHYENKVLFQDAARRDSGGA